MPVIEAQAVTKRYETGRRVVHALRDVTLDIETGEFVTIVGPSGSGKSTLLNLFGLLDTPTSGSVEVAGSSAERASDVERTRIRKRHVGFVFQEFFLIPTLTARENVLIPRLLGDGLPRAERRASELLERVGLADRPSHYPNELSGGQKQRVAVARALINDPDIVLADEPTGNLDRETSGHVLRTLDGLTENDVTVVAVTHDQYVTEFADRTLLLSEGRLLDNDGDTADGDSQWTML